MATSKLFTASGLLGILLCGCATKLSNADLLRNGYDELNAGNYQSAETKFQQSLVGYQSSGIQIGQLWAMIALGDVFLEQGNFDAAIAQYDKCDAFANQQNIAGGAEAIIRLEHQMKSAWRGVATQKADPNIFYDFLLTRSPGIHLKTQLLALQQSGDRAKLIEFVADNTGNQYSRLAMFELFKLDYLALAALSNESLERFNAKYNPKLINSFLSDYVTQTKGGKVRLRPQINAALKIELPAKSPIEVIDLHHGWFRVLLANGQQGWVNQADVELQVKPTLSAELTSFIALNSKGIRDFHYDNAKNSSEISAVENFLFLYPDDSSLSVITERLVSLYRLQDNFAGYMAAYELTKDKEDIKNAYRLASTQQENKRVELALFNSFDPHKFVKIDLTASRESELKQFSGSSLVVSFKGVEKNFYRQLTVAMDKSSGVPFKYGDYKVKLKVKFNLDYTIPINGKGKDFHEKEIFVNLNASNNFKDVVHLNFDNVPVNGSFHSAAAGLISGLANMFGQNMSSSDLDINTNLRSTQLDYELVQAQGE